MITATGLHPRLYIFAAMTYPVTLYLIILVAVLLLMMASKKLRIAYPIILVLGGLLISVIPGFPSISIDPSLIFTIFLPPLLYEAAWYTSWKELWKWRRVISSFAFLIVLITSLLIAWVAHALLPDFSWALGFLLGGIVSPPDAVSATAILKHVKVPRRVSSIIEGESLLNDASSLVVFRFALIAVNTGAFAFHEATFSFFWIILAGIAVGIIVAALIFYLHRWLPTDINSEILFTLLTPYFLFIAAESIHVSGVLAVVSGGLFLASRRNRFLSFSSRLHGTSVWSVLVFTLNGIIFILIGLELPVIVRNLGNVSLTSAILYGLLITFVLMGARIACALGASAFTSFISRFIKTADSRPGWKSPLVFGWAGMRGVVSLAAALSIPAYTLDGTNFPQRNLILFITFIVIITTIVIQGLTLPALIRTLHLEDPDHYPDPVEQEKRILEKLSADSKVFMQTHYQNEFTADSNFLLSILKPDLNALALEKKSETPDIKNVYTRLLAYQRNWLWELNKDLNYDEEVIRKLLLVIDMEEEKLRIIAA